MDDLVIRRAEPADASAIAEVDVEGWRWGYRGLVDPDFLASLSVERREAMWSRSIDDPSQDVIVAEHGGVVVGFAAIAPSGDEDTGPETGELLMIYQREDVAGTGVGRALLRRPHELLRNRGFETATPWVLDGNERGRVFYERNGWRPDGTVKVEERGVTLCEVRYRIDLT